MTAPRTPAELFTVAEAETALGGRERSLEPLGRLWIAVRRTHRSVRSEGGGPPVGRLRSVAESGLDDRVAEGIRVRFEGADWRLVHALRNAPRMGRMTLTLERDET